MNRRRVLIGHTACAYMARNKLVYKSWTFYDPAITGGTMLREQDLASASLPSDSLTVEVRCASSSILNFKLNEPMVYYYRDRQRGTYYIQGIERTGTESYRLSGLSAVALLSKTPHAGGVYRGITAEQLAHEICGDIPLLVKTSLAGIEQYGWLPYAQPPERSARDNLAALLFSLGAYLTTDLNGVLRIEPLWDGEASTIPASRIYMDASVDYEPAISSVVVTEHQYVEGEEEAVLFEGTAMGNDFIIFNEPMHSLSAVGFTVAESGQNYARLSGGSGTLTGKRYIHNTRLITRTVTAGATENVQSVPDATLVTLVNSNAVAERLAEYYRHRETIRAGLVAGAERAGDVVSIYHPYERQMVSACIASLETTMSAVLRSDSAARVGFLPPKAGSGYNNATETITASGAWVSPIDGLVRAVLIGGGDGGWSGLPGEAFSNPNEESWSYDYSNRVDCTKVIVARLGAAGGKPGEPGGGGKVLVVQFTAVKGQSYTIVIGQGGAGAVYSAEGSAAGSPGGATTFGPYSSANGSASPYGYYDDITGSRYAMPGEAGVHGGNGSGQHMDPQGGEYWGEIVIGDSITVNGQTWTPGVTLSDTNTKKHAEATDVEAVSYGGYGGGAAYGANGGNAQNNGLVKAQRAGSLAGQSYPPRGEARGGDGGDGATALPPPAATGLGRGGSGGNGGGGPGSWGHAGITISFRKDEYSVDWDSLVMQMPHLASPGDGSNGGKGAAGGVLLYYSIPLPDTSGALKESGGAWMLDKLGRRIIV